MRKTAAILAGDYDRHHHYALLAESLGERPRLPIDLANLAPLGKIERMDENRSNLLLIEFDAAAMTIAELQAFHAVLFESLRYAPRFSQWIANEFLRPELERRQSGGEAPAKRYYPFPSDWTDGEVGQALLVTTGMITGADFAPSAKPFLAQVAQQIAGIAASRLIERK